MSLVLVVQLTVAVALEFRILELVAKLLAHALVFGDALDATGAVSAVLGHGILQLLDQFGIRIQGDFHHWLLIFLEKSFQWNQLG
jgi:hypothetical protein